MVVLAMTLVMTHMTIGEGPDRQQLLASTEAQRLVASLDHAQRTWRIGVDLTLQATQRDTALLMYPVAEESVQRDLKVGPGCPPAGVKRGGILLGCI